MSDPIKFLTSVGQALATMSLYSRGHPARERVVDDSYQQLLDLIASSPDPRFSFIDGEVVFYQRVLRELKDWEWATRLAEVGVQRVEFEADIARDDYEAFLTDVFNRMKGETKDTSEGRFLRRTGIRYGPITVAGQEGDETAASFATATIAYSLKDDIETIEWMHNQVMDAGSLPLLEAETVVRSLSLAMHSQEEIILPLLQLKEFDQYTTTHSSNVAVLAMALGEAIGLRGKEVRVLGVAGLLHDLGKVRIPHEVLVKPGQFTEEERGIMQRHPTDGAKIIMERDVRLEVPAVVAYEHHIMLNGEGYPAFYYERDTHYASRLVHICDVYDALCTNRPYRDAWTSDAAIAYIEERSGGDFDPHFSVPFVNMMRGMQRQQLTYETPVVNS